MVPLFAQEGELQLQGSQLEKCTLILSENEMRFQGAKHQIVQMFDAASCQIERVTAKQKILLWSVEKKGVQIYFSPSFAPCFFFKQAETIEFFFAVMVELKRKCLKEAEEINHSMLQPTEAEASSNPSEMKPEEQGNDMPVPAEADKPAKQEMPKDVAARGQTANKNVERHIIHKEIAADAEKMLDDIQVLLQQADTLRMKLKSMESKALGQEESNKPPMMEGHLPTEKGEENISTSLEWGEKDDMPNVEPVLAETAVDDSLQGEEAASLHAISEEQTEKVLSWKAQYVQVCRDFGMGCANHVPNAPAFSAESSDNDSPLPFLFDLANCRFSHMQSAYSSCPMPLYFYSKGRLVKCNKNGFYQKPLRSPYMLLTGEDFDGQNEILHHAIEDSVDHQAVQSAEEGLMCLMPDVLDDFHHALRDQLNWKGTRLFPVPRSIALAYVAYGQSLMCKQQMPKEFLCLDYDGEEMSAIKITSNKDKDGSTYFIRWGQQRMEGQHPSYRSLAKAYVKCYKDKYHVPLTQAMENELINTKLLQQLLLTDGSVPVLMANDQSPIDLWPDWNIVAQLHDKVEKDMQAVSKAIGKPVYAICSFGLANDRLFYGADALEEGCKEIRRRYQENKTLWEEYLPELSLEVHRDGVFNELELIKEKDRHQKISMAYLNEKIQFTVNNGTIILTKGKEHYDLPLIREVYGSVNREKLARFDLSKPLSEDTEVALHIRYSYGDVDSYKLIAVAENGMTFESYWCDTEMLANNPPHYHPDFMKGNNAKNNKDIVNGFKEFVARVKAPAALKEDMTYFYARDEKHEHPYSRYLEALNGRYGFPYRPIGQYFDKRNQTKEVCAQIQGMLNNGTFDAIAATLCGTLPGNHRLEKGTSKTFPKGDQAKVLRNNLEQICREFGVLYTYDEPAVKEIIDAIREIKPENKMDAIQTWAPITAYVTRENDHYGIWDSFSQALKTLKNQSLYTRVQDLRAISSVCYKTEAWIFELYHGANGKENVNILMEGIFAYLQRGEWQKDNYNPRILRDLLELLLCICMLKQEDPTILDCNAPETKQLVKRLKQIDQEIRTLGMRGRLKNKFDSRIRGYVIPPEYCKVNPVIYCLVQTLSGGESINLVGFEEGNP